ncbi:hypothetical protein Kpol_2002p26 [Vanderwaltozyma polyspora DSM 70294]|uniref:Zn(2)-C6 fungal-type domain-containing protein n=1 Tax=Vanderwaltozyma polyspora (strain ATCC 22028 / DSM 70294 / BCRC 21397 / CBS 2163 / NBRC 10782 / NRRL Y-8283 / UCD 57-17) TaxID=436907 RepID=A7TFE2_VANPO|nr:uncharacterized protein Kpol_2002p26 [Vanderwaltozyma polyspora DSM 70294]EDO18956.1 hypothetical protein Kpol_2002p26 [Vanderwaltozyma polyspora DSM 70294]
MCSINAIVDSDITGGNSNIGPTDETNQNAKAVEVIEIDNDPVNTNSSKNHKIAKTPERPVEQSLENRHISKRPRKKRKTFSCDVCRKFKTRCDFEPLVGKCHRCNMLQLVCSLTKERESEILAAIEDSSKVATFPVTSIASIAKNIVKNGSERKVRDTAKEQVPVLNPLTHTLTNRLNRLEEKFSSLEGKIELVLMLLQGSTSAATNAKDVALQSMIQLNTMDKPLQFGSMSNTSINKNEFNQESDKSSGEGYSTDSDDNEQTFDGIKLKEPPLKLITDIDERLFPTAAKSEDDVIARQQRPFVVARVEFLKFYEKNKQLCHNLARDFLVRSHFWIIPGGIKEIDDEYARNHLFITSVFTIIAMSFDENDKYADEQETLYPLVETLLTNTLTMFERLTDFDIEAILYCCMFHISRKTKHHRQLKFNSLVLSNFAIHSMLNVVDFHQIKHRVLVDEDYTADDLYHLRILNSLTATFLEYAISYGNVSEMDKNLMELNNLTAKYPKANFADDIKISEINLGDTVNKIFLKFRGYYREVKERFIEKEKTEPEKANNSSEILIFPELDYWLKNWEELLAKDGGGVLLFTFDYYHIMICRSFISEFLTDMQNTPRFLNSTLKTLKDHSFSLLHGFLRLPPSLIKGAPIFTTHQLVYACLTLCDFLHWFDQDERQLVLSMCTRVYWHLNTIGEKKNDATDSVGKIIKSIIDTSKRRVSLTNFPPLNSKLISSSTAELSTATSFNNNRVDYSGAASPESEISYHSNTAGPEGKSTPSLAIPDVDQFNSFEDFFQDFFDNLKPTTQRIFTSRK